MVRFWKEVIISHCSAHRVSHSRSWKWMYRLIVGSLFMCRWERFQPISQWVCFHLLCKNHGSRLSESAQAAIINYHRPDGLNNRHFFLAVMEAGKSYIRVPADLVPGENLLLGYGPKWPFLGESVGTERGWDLLSHPLFNKTLNPITGDPSSWPHLSLVISQRPHLQILSHCGLELQHMNFAGYKHSISNTITLLLQHKLSLIQNVYFVFILGAERQMSVHWRLKLPKL